MMFVLSGEGPSDLGVCRTSCPCEGEDLCPGPMALLLDILAKEHLQYRPIEDTKAVCYLNKHNLESFAKTNSNLLRNNPKMRLPGTKNAKDTAFFFRNAQALGLYAAKLSANGKDPDIVAVLFRDCDGTNSSSRSLWNEKFESMKNGFLAAGFDRGVPMLPKPKSEAWLLCAVKEQPYQRCCALENESGNDASPNSLKGQLAAALGKEPTAERLTELVKDGTVDPHRIDMPSFNAFKEALLQAIRA